MRLAPVLIVVAATLAAGCGRQDDRERVIVLGLDGMEPSVVERMIDEGTLPNFRRLRDGGASGLLRSSKPLLSPIIWTTIATGKPPDAHGIGHFVATNPRTGKELPVTSAMRKVKALWNILSEAGRSVAVVGWWATWPAEPVRGAVVSDHTCYHFLFPDGGGGEAEPAGITYPADLLATLRPAIRRPDDLGPADVAPFITVSQEELSRRFDFSDDLSDFKWALATAQTYQRVGIELWQREHPDVLLVYIEGTDSVAHLFGHLFRAQDLAGELAAQQVKFGGAVEAMYRYADEIVGRYLAVMDDRTTLIVLSDHGFSLGDLPDDPSMTRDLRRVSERYHRIDGILYLYGRDVRRGTRIEGATILDIAPTVLALAGVAPAIDMSGRVLTDAVTVPDGPRTVASFEGAPTAAAPVAAAAPAVDDAVIEHLKSLGYLQSASPRGDRTLANLAFEAGRYAEAAATYEALVRDAPGDAALHASLAGALGALGRLDEAREQLRIASELDPLGAEAHHNQAVILERQGKRDEAIVEYRAALRYHPDYEPSRTALQRLGAADRSGAPRDPSQERARQLAARAEQSARRGAYDEALATLDEADRLAPRDALLAQYRSNVAYLKGDRAAAIAALERGLELEPDNQLFRQNLRRLREETTTTR
jgi:predicted AlkP superfamily phosphohydrolase/phosphomutase/predicted negative regulator of RcsB-dependent stress response